jgi:hypothetical protein
MKTISNEIDDSSALEKRGWKPDCDLRSATKETLEKDL